MIKRIPPYIPAARPRSGFLLPFHDYLSTRHLPYSYPYGYILVSTYLHPCIRTDTKMQIRRYKDADT
ncbi:MULTISPECIES: hypothetical protein [Parabacteroides]|uniref:Uncharacterized protein n=2 Tax=Parabacteroides distasonis TaxID=823 RepID=A0A6I2P366_PARDI|nr:MULTISPECIES: hypothetical protein [Parabacteroides]KDS40762.1 hypothetical protein M091_3681 [Parabacteroides distasonis str. 3776 D15 i]MDB9002289.1 hypothetical protein [Parabacteroides distasonis]MDB9019066.1 hypothetical protein [Parabacteroides distasonis]MDB9056659.1 hypothetical protein [Parabacteroides distasonis]MRY85080.1 hypothetical protein [Parabacteroides distasonis]